MSILMVYKYLDFYENFMKMRFLHIYKRGRVLNTSYHFWD